MGSYDALHCIVEQQQITATYFLSYDKFDSIKINYYEPCLACKYKNSSKIWPAGCACAYWTQFHSPH